MLYLSKPEFLYPRARDYAFDEVAEQLVHELELRHFDVPGLDVEFRVYGSGRQRMRYVSRIQGEDFSVKFGRGQGSMPGNKWANTAAVDSVVIPREKISVYGDNAGPSYWLYVGPDWHRDRDNFLTCFHSPSVNPRLKEEPRPYLFYKGSAETSRHVRYRGPRGYANYAHYLVHCNDLGREYDPIDDEPRYLVTQDVVERMAAYLRGVLERVQALPANEEPFEFVEDEPVAVQGSPAFYVVVDDRAEARISKRSAEPAKQYALYSGWRLCSLGIESCEGLNPLVYEGFIWAGLDEESIPWEGRSSSWGGSTYLVRITPKYANDIYVVDQAPYDRMREELSKVAQTERRINFTREEIDAYHQARGLTFVSWADYDGTYEKPIVLVQRELDFDEVTIVQELQAT